MTLPAVHPPDVLGLPSPRGLSKSPNPNIWTVEKRTESRKSAPSLGNTAVDAEQAIRLMVTKAVKPVSEGVSCDWIKAAVPCPFLWIGA